MQSFGYRAFKPLGPITIIAGDTTAPTGVQVTGPQKAPEPVSYEVGNPSLNDAYLGWAPTAAGATTNTVIPTAGNPKQNCTWIPAKSIRAMSFPFNSFFSAITAAGTAGITMQAGEGR